jgi:hypothetical protein
MRGFLTAVSAEAVKPLGSLVQQNFTAPGEIQDRRPISEPRDDALPAAKTDRAAEINALLYRGETKPVEDGSKAEGQGGTSDHRILLRGADIVASTMPAGCLVAALRENQVMVLDEATARVMGKRNRARVIVRRASQ